MSNELHYFHFLARADQEKTVQRLASSRMSVVTIATLTGLSVEKVIHLLAPVGKVFA